MNAPVMLLYHRLYVKQADAIAFDGRPAFDGYPVEFVEYVWQMFFRYTEPVVGYADNDGLVCRMGGYLNKRGVGRIFNGVVQKVADDIVKVCAVSLQ